MPLDSEEKMKEWIFKRWKEKDELLDYFKEHQHFPSKVQHSFLIVGRWLTTFFIAGGQSSGAKASPNSVWVDAVVGSTNCRQLLSLLHINGISLRGTFLDADACGDHLQQESSAMARSLAFSQRNQEDCISCMVRVRLDEPA